MEKPRSKESIGKLSFIEKFLKTWGLKCLNLHDTNFGDCLSKEEKI